MSDLISRSELYMNDLIRRKDVLALFPTNDCSDKMVGLYERILDIPTAYSVEKVVAELEDKLLSSSDAHAEAITGMCGASANVYYGEKSAYTSAIDIVRKGGAE